MRLKGVLNCSNNASFVIIHFADGHLKPSFFLPENQIINKSKYQQQCQSH